MKRLFDFCFSAVFLILFSPLFLLSLGLVWLSDFHSPFFFSQRVGLKEKSFNIVKVRTMFWQADQSLSITPQNDPRITFWGGILRALKWDEFPQFWNVFKGDMSLVGPRPDVFEGGVSLYMNQEKKILTVRPGIVDLASIIFSKEGQILKDFSNPEEAYYQKIFPLKKRLMLFYVENHSFLLDCWVFWGVFLLFFSYSKATACVIRILSFYQASPFLIRDVEKIRKFPHPD